MKLPASILIANRGEIAARVIRTCRKLGIRSIAIHSEADRDSPYVAAADIAIAIGGNTPAESYLDMQKILEAARISGAEAIHPGYGFLAENAAFATACTEAGILFIGPRPEAIAQMGSKGTAKILMRAAGVPVVPGYDGEDQRAGILQQEAAAIGYPVLLKAVAGGGGKGMRIVHSESEFYDALLAAKAESLQAFGDDQILLEKYFPSVRHIEFQIFGDHHGNVIHLMERECTIQRRYQKVIEETPSPALDETLRTRMAKAAVEAAKAIRYDNAGTVEFILTDSGEFYFLEVNTRLQVEHPVTEMTTGLDLVEWQIQVAAGNPLPKSQEEIAARGYAIECRLYAENPANGFRPDTGKILRWQVPKVEGLRVDSGIEEGSIVSTYYDPMLAKLTVWAQDRAEALRKMAFTLRNLQCLGLETNRHFLMQLMLDEAVQAGNYDTHFLQNWQSVTGANERLIDWACIAATVRDWTNRESKRAVLRSLPSGWRNQVAAPARETFRNGEAFKTLSYSYRNGQFDFETDRKHSVKLLQSKGAELRISIDGMQCDAVVVASGDSLRWVQIEGSDFHLEKQARLPVVTAGKAGGGYVSPMPAQVLRVLVIPGQQVQAGQSLVVISSMKMESTILAETDGTVSEVLVREGQNIAAKAELLRIEAHTSSPLPPSNPQAQ